MVIDHVSKSWDDPPSAPPEVYHRYTPRKLTNIAPENGWLEDVNEQ